jgi:competence protein ComEA
MKNALYVLLGVMAGFVLAGLLVFVSRAPEGEPIILQPAPTKAPIAVHIIGAVPRPGLYEFAEGARLQNAIDAAGGLLASANVDSLNLAALLEDGQQLNIPYKEGAAPTEPPAELELPSSSQEPTADPNVELLDINIATLEELIALPGIGPSTAQKIIDYRTENGPFSTVDDLDKVSGIGPSTLDQIRALVIVN